MTGKPCLRCRLFADEQVMAVLKIVKHTCRYTRPC
jgi:hypothetical protein